jgi:ABC-type branched-chain amino acid transport systems, ATPase component
MNIQENPLLKVSHITKKFGGLVAIKNVNTQVKSGCLKAIIGPNGAGKTTTFNIISGIIPATEGEIWFEGKNITNRPTHAIAKMGVARTFQHPCIFHDMTVLENVLAGATSTAQNYFIQSFTGRLFGKLQINKVINEAERRAIEMLEFVGLGGKINMSAKILAYGEQKVLELARALALDPKPKLLLLDEPTAGLNSEEAKTYMDILKKLKKTNLTILMIEHRMELVENVSDEVLVLDFGEVLADDTPAAVWANKKVVDAYLGSSDACSNVTESEEGKDHA